MCVCVLSNMLPSKRISRSRIFNFAATLTPRTPPPFHIVSREEKTQAFDASGISITKMWGIAQSKAKTKLIRF